MQWNSVTDFFVMGGHGYYVWCAYAMAAFLVAAESVSLFLGRRVAKNAVKKEAVKLAVRKKAVTSSTNPTK